MKFKSVFGAFIFVCFALSVGAVVFVHSKSFGSLLTRVLTDIGEKKTNTKIALKNVQMSLFPPGIEFNKVSVKKKISDVENFEAEFGKLGFYLGLVELEERKLTLGEIRFSESVIRYQSPEKDETLTEIPEETIKKIFTISENLPIRVDTVLVENSFIYANHDLLEAKRIKLVKVGKNFVTRFHLANLAPSPKSDFSVDEIWGEAEIGQNDIKLHRLKVQHDVHSIVLKGKVHNYRLLKNAEASFNGEAQAHLKNVKNLFPVPENLQMSSGNALMDFSLSMKDQNFEGKANLKIKDLKSGFLQAEDLTASLNINNSLVSLTNLEMKEKEQKLKLLKPAAVFDIKSKTILPDVLSIEAEQFALTNALSILGPKFGIIRARLTGTLEFRFQKKLNLYFKPRDGFILQDLALVVGKKSFEILHVKKAVLKNADISYADEEFRLKALIEANRTILDVDGFVNKKKISFVAPQSKVNLEDLGNIAQIGVKGEGILDLDVSGPPDDVSINLLGKTKGFEVLGYRLGTSEEDITISLKDDSVLINRLESDFRSTHISGSGSVNYGNLDIALDIKSNATTFSDLSQILHPIFSKITFLPEDLNFMAKVDASVFGKTKMADLRVKAGVQFTDLVAFRENINSGSLEVNLQNQTLSINGLKALKDKGSLAGDFSFNIPRKIINVDYTWKDLRLSSFNVSRYMKLNLDGKINGSIKGGGSLSDFDLRLNTALTDTRSASFKFDDTTIDLAIRPQRYTGELKAFGKNITSTFDVSTKKGRRSDLKLKVNFPDIRPLTIALLGQHLEDANFTGSFKFDLKSDFVDDFKRLNLTATLKDLTFRHPDFNVSYVSKTPEFVIAESRIKRWLLDIKENDVFLHTRGSGNIQGQYSLVNELHLNSKILEILVRRIASAQGFLRNVVRMDGSKGDLNFSASSQADQLNLTIDGVPFPINDLRYSLQYANDRLFIQELNTTLESGTVDLKGDVYFAENNPDVNIKFVFDKAEIPILNKSAVNISGDGTILGNRPPYVLSGDFVLNKTLIVNELGEFGSKTISQVRYLPKNQESPLDRLLTLNVDVKADNPIRITNSLMDIALRGEVRLNGNPSHPRGEGRLYAPVNTSRVYFKNNEYLLTNADITLSPNKEVSNPDFDVTATTMISTYRVTAKAYGDLETFNIDLSSDPMLTRNSILSLVAFGYTDEIQNALEPGQKQSLTSVGVGSFVFDRFKINDILNKQFGLQLNLGTVFEQSGKDSLLSGRSQEGSYGPGGIGRTRSGTKIELKKRLDEATSVAVSSTMGSGIGQRQSMNLIYNLNQKVQLEGVYETRSNEDDIEYLNYNSIGGDLKFRWTYK
jgi:hypothetical protein